MTKIITPMIIKREKEFFMLEAYCFWCGYKKVIPVRQYNQKVYCPRCRRVLRKRWISLGTKLDYSEYFTKKVDRRMKRGKADLI